MKKVLFLARLFNPHKGGVETHLFNVSQELVKKGYEVTVITEQFEDDLTFTETVNSIEILRIPFDLLNSKTKLWRWMWQHRELFSHADVVHVHDVAWWVVPVIPMIAKKYFITFHGWEGVFPPKKSAILQRRGASALARGVIQVGEYIKTWYGTNPDVVTYGGVKLPTQKKIDIKETFNKLWSAVKQGSFLSKENLAYEAIFIGRLSEDNDVRKVIEFFELIKKDKPEAKFVFVGDGPLASECQEVGTVTGFVSDVFEYISKTKIVCASSYLSIMETQVFGKLVCAFYSNPLKREYLECYPMDDKMIVALTAEEAFEKLLELNEQPEKLRQMISIAQQWAREQTWEKVANEYINLWEK